MAVFELTAKYDSRKSFYNKAIVYEDMNGRHLILRSYNTVVAEIMDGKVIRADIGVHSVTTNRHIREFIKQFAKEEN